MQVITGPPPETLALLASRSLLRGEAAAGGPQWLPAVLVFGSIAAVAYADFIVTSISLGYLYFLPLGISAMFLRSQISYGLIAVCVFLHDLFGDPYPSPGARITHNLTALVGFTFVVYVIQRYVKQRELLDQAVRKQRDQLLQDVELAAQVQGLFLPIHRPSIAGLEIAGTMRPMRGVGGDYYNRLNNGIHSVSDGDRYVTLLLADIDALSRSLRYINCGHNPALLFRRNTRDVVRMNSSCLPLGMFDNVSCEIDRADLTAGDLLVMYTDGITEAENSQGEEFGLERLSAVIRRDSLLSAKELTDNIFQSAAEFCREVGFSDDATVLIVKCNFDGA